jgi:RNA ligase (TIGR02306 family)
MSNWKVSKEKISLFTHPNADQLQLGRVGSYQVVVQKGLYQDGDEVVFAPEKSILSGQIKQEFEKYLSGSNKDRVKAVRLRGEISTGIIIPKHLVNGLDELVVGEDVSEKLGIQKYEPPIPVQLSGQVSRFEMPHIGHHDCEHAGVYLNEMINGERVVISEKIHGSQFILAHNIDTGETIVSSKGLLKSGLIIQENEDNSYWQATRHDGIVEKITTTFESGVVQVFGEVIPVQKGYNYGQTKPTARLFDIRHNSKSIPYDQVPDVFKSLWVPIVFDGPIQFVQKEVVIYSDSEKGIHKTKIDNILPDEVIAMAESKERISGKQLHWSEGVVIRPYVDRWATDGTKLRLKVISKYYKESGEEIN